MPNKRDPMLLLLFACTPAYEITVSPPTVDLGTVDFDEEMPEEGYAPLEVSVTNTGDRPVGALALVSYDTERICVQGFTGRSLPIDLGELGEGSTYLLRIAVCGSPPGDRDSLVQTDVTLSTDGDPATVVIPVEYTPTRTISDTGA